MFDKLSLENYIDEIEFGFELIPISGAYLFVTFEYLNWAMFFLV